MGLAGERPTVSGLSLGLRGRLGGTKGPEGTKGAKWDLRRALALGAALGLRRALALGATLGAALANLLKLLPNDAALLLLREVASLGSLAAAVARNNILSDILAI